MFSLPKLQEPDQVYEGITFEDFLKVSNDSWVALLSDWQPCWVGGENRAESLKPSGYSTV